MRTTELARSKLFDFMRCSQALTLFAAVVALTCQRRNVKAVPPAMSGPVSLADVVLRELIGLRADTHRHLPAAAAAGNQRHQAAQE